MEEEMEELHVEGVAAHDDPESCVDDPQGRGEALTGACAGRAIEPRNQGVRGADVVTRTEGTIAGGASASRQGTPRGQRTRACTEPPCARTGRSHDCPPTRRGAGRSGKAMPYARDELLWEVGQPHSTCEAAEQGRESGCGGGGGKGAGRGKHGHARRAPDTGPELVRHMRWIVCAGEGLAQSDARPEPGAQCGSSARWGLCGGPPERAVPTASLLEEVWVLAASNRSGIATGSSQCGQSPPTPTRRQGRTHSTHHCSPRWRVWHSLTLRAPFSLIRVTGCRRQRGAGRAFGLTTRCGRRWPRLRDRFGADG